MADQQSSLENAVHVGTTANHLKQKLASPMVQAAKNGAGAFLGAAIGAVLENRETIKKTAAAITVVLLLPLLFLTMLPGLVFGDLSENSGVLNSGTLINENLRAAKPGDHGSITGMPRRSTSRNPARGVKGSRRRYGFHHRPLRRFHFHQLQPADRPVLCQQGKLQRDQYTRAPKGHPQK